MKSWLLSLILGGICLLTGSASAQDLQVNGYGIVYPYNPYYLSPTYYGYSYGPRFNTYAPGPPNSGYFGKPYHGVGGRRGHAHGEW